MWSLLMGKFQKGACRYLLHRYLGQYLKEKVTVDQLTVNLLDGTGSVTDVSLDCEALNQLAEQHNLPIEFMEGTLEEINFSVPWKTIMQESCEIQIKGMRVTVHPKNRNEHGGSMIESMFTSMASSMQLAEECIKNGEDVEDDQDLDNGGTEISGLEHCAQTIDAVLSRVKITFHDTVVRVERCVEGSEVGVGLEFHVNLWKYSDDSTNNSGSGSEDSTASDSAFSHKKITLEGVTCHSEIFSSKEYFEKLGNLFHGHSTSGEDEGDDESDGEQDSAKPVKTVQVGKFSGLHEIKLQVKTNESIAGPQVSIDCNFGSLIALMTPLQAHIVYNLLNEIIDPSPSTGASNSNRRSFSEKPMDSYDFKRVEKELQERAKPENIGFSGLAQQQGWSSAYADESDDEFMPLPGRNMHASTTSHFMNTSVFFNTSINSSMHHSMTDSLNMSTYKSAYNYASAQSTSTPNSSDKTKFSLSFASISLILLHEDIMSLSSTDAVFPDSLQKMQATSRKFFENLYYFGATVKGEKDIIEVRKKMNEACDLSHHRLIAAPLKVKGMVKGTLSGGTETSGILAAGYFEMIESIKDEKSTPSTHTPNPQCIEVITFPRTFDSVGTQAVKMDFKTESRKGRGNHSASKTKLEFTLRDCRAELDISVVDRINSLINSPLRFYAEPNEPQGMGMSPSHRSNKSDSLIRINVNATELSLDFRFPIPDLRPPEDTDRVPHWIRNVHNDSVIIQMKEASFSTVLSTKSDVLEFDTKCHEVNLFYKTTPNDTPVLFATGLSDDPEVDGPSMCTQGLDWPRILVWISPKATQVLLENDSAEESDAFDTMNIMSMPKKKASPFSSKRIVHETHDPSDEEAAQGSESVIPGDRNEMMEFIEDATKSVEYKIELNFRFVNLSLPSKHFFEELYNRVGNDLLLWEPACIKTNELSRERSPYRVPNFNAFSMCKSALRIDPDSDEEGEQAAFYTPSLNSATKAGAVSASIVTGQSEVTLSLSIGKGIGSFYAPLQDGTGNHVPGQSGQFTFKVEQASLFFVSGFKGDRNLGYLCLISQRAELYHADYIRNGHPLPRLTPELVRTIFPTDESMLPNNNRELSGSDMLSVAIQIDREPSKNLKIFKVATGIREGTLDHRLYKPNRTWFTQLVDFFDVTDMPILGYTPSTVLTELHLHLWNCSIDYKPIHLPLRAILAMETFSISSNIAAQTSTSVLRFLAEDAAFFLSAKPDSCSRLREDFVCVMDMDYFELSLRLCSNKNSQTPRIDLSAISNALHIRTCSDSFKALLEILTYYTNDGDLYDIQQRSRSGSLRSVTQYSPSQENLNDQPALILTEEIVPALERKLSIQSHSEQLPDLVADAMVDDEREKESTINLESKTKARSSFSKPMYDLHFTPMSSGSANVYDHPMDSSVPTLYPNVPVLETSNGLPVDINPSDEDDEEFCILGSDPGVGIIPKNGEPEARVLTDEPIRLIENYFTPPTGKLDALRAPKHYPSPVSKYGLKEMTIVLHFYGGDDFGLGPSRKSSGKSEERGSSETVYGESWKEHFPAQNYYEPSEVDMAIDALNPGVVFSKTKAFESAWEAYESPRVPTKSLPEGCAFWRDQGGKGRRHDVQVELHLSKIKFVHEIYPDTAEQASRQALVINNVEVLDKLKSSQFNKMLYLYTTPTRPKQTHAHMVTIKAVHVRPEPQLNIEECCLKISLLPVRLNVDQDALLFLYQYFSDLSSKCDSEDDDSLSGRLTNPPSHTPSVESLPIMTVNTGENSSDKDNASGTVNLEEDPSNVNLLMFNDDPFAMEENVSNCSRDPSVDSTKSSGPIFFRQVIFAPEVPIRLDYRGKRVDMTHGPLAGLLMGLAQLDCSEIRLKQVYYRHGILGFDRLVAFLINEWATDIKKNQLPSLLGGVGPIHSFVQLFQGMRDLFWLPIEQYQKDGRIAKGLQRGVNSFSTSTAMAALDLTNKFIQTIQSAAEFTYDMVSPGPSVQQKRRQTSKRRKRYNQPGDIREGMTNAYNVVREGLGDTANSIVRVASKEHEQKGISGAVGGVMRQIPPTVVRPIIFVAEATSNVINGFRSQLEPEFRKETEEKWKET